MLLDASTLDACAYAMIICAVAAAVVLVFKRPAPYGRYSVGAGGLWAWQINGRLSWIIQELPSLLAVIATVALATPQELAHLSSASRFPNWTIMSLFILHYIHRTFIFPLRIRGGKPSAGVTTVLAFIFCSVNGTMQSQYVLLVAEYPLDYLTSTRFVIGSILFAVGMAINIHSDSILLNLRKPGETGYKIPRGGMFELVSGANFLGEIIEWGGFAIAAGGLPSLAFALFTALNIGPRAVNHHNNYLEKFKGEYPTDRKAIIPFLL